MRFFIAAMRLFPTLATFIAITCCCVATHAQTGYEALKQTTDNFISPGIKIKVLEYDQTEELAKLRITFLFVEKAIDHLVEDLCGAIDERIKNKDAGLPSITLTFDKVHLPWDKERKSYYCEGELPLSEINGFPVEFPIGGMIELKNNGGPGNSIMAIDLELLDKSYYRFYYSQGFLQCYSSQDRYNRIIAKAPYDSRTITIYESRSSYEENGHYDILVQPKLATW